MSTSMIQTVIWFKMSGTYCILSEYLTEHSSRVYDTIATYITKIISPNDISHIHLLVYKK